MKMIVRNALLGLCLLLAVAGMAAGRNEARIAQVKAGQLAEARADWWGYDPADATRCLQEAIDSGVKRLIVPNMGTPWLVHPIQLASNQEIVLEPGTVIEAISGGFKDKNACLLSATGKANIIIRGSEGATLRMRKKDYQDPTQYTRAEWRHTLALKSCENIQVRGLSILSSGGDGIYVGSNRQPMNYCKDIVIQDCVIDDHHRQGISVISVVNLLIENCVIKNTRGTMPQAGIDFEPNAKEERLFGIVVRNCRFENNAGGAVILCSTPRKDTEPISFHFENLLAIENRFQGGFGQTPPMDRITFTMINCVERFKGQEKVYTDFWRDWQGMRPLNAAQQAVVDTVGRMWSKEMKLRPVEPAAQATAIPKPILPKLRGKAHYLIWVGPEDLGEVTVGLTLHRDDGRGMKVTVMTPSGQAAPILKVDGKATVSMPTPDAEAQPVFEGLIRGDVRRTLTFEAAEAGTYLMELDPRAWWFSLDPNGHRAVILAPDKPANFFMTSTTYYFYVPAGVTDFYVYAAGQGTEKVKISIFNAAGDLVDGDDDVSIASRFVLHRPKETPGEIWAIKVEKSPGFYMEDYSLDLYGVPPILATDKRALLMP